MIFVAVQLLTLARLIVAKYPYRWFLCALSLWCVQAINCTYFPGTTRQWTATYWMYPEIALMLATAAACIETIEHERAHLLPIAALQLRVASTGLTGAIVITGCRFISTPAGDTLSMFLGIRMWMWASMAIALGVAGLLIRMNNSRLSQHSFLLLIVLCAHALASPFWDAPNAQKVTMRYAYRPVIIGCCLIWALAGGKLPLLRRETSPSI